MKEQLIKYGFVDRGVLEYKKNGWEFTYRDGDDYWWAFAPNGGAEDGICLTEMDYEKIIRFIEFVIEYK